MQVQEAGIHVDCAKSTKELLDDLPAELVVCVVLWYLVFKCLPVLRQHLVAKFSISDEIPSLQGKGNGKALKDWIFSLETPLVSDGRG